MYFNRLIILWAVLFLQLSSALSAEESFWLDLGYSQMTQLKGAEEILSPKQHMDYMEILGRGKCDEAISLLNKAFVAYYPQYAHAGENGGRSYNGWRTYVINLAYPAASLCEGLRQLSDQEEITKKPTRLSVFIYRANAARNLNLKGIRKAGFFAIL